MLAVINGRIIRLQTLPLKEVPDFPKAKINVNVRPHEELTGERLPIAQPDSMRAFQEEALTIFEGQLN